MDKHALSDKVIFALLRSKLDYIFPPDKVVPSLVQNPFMANINDVEENFQEKILDLEASGTANKMFTASN